MRAPFLLSLLLVVVAFGLVVIVVVTVGPGGSVPPPQPQTAMAASPTPTPTAEPSPSPTPSTPAVVGLLQFRGNLTRSSYGRGPVPRSPQVLWRYPDEPMCARDRSVDKVWCGTGWTGQPAVWERPDGVTEVVFGAYDRAVHFVDAATGVPTRPRFVTGDIIKGSVTIDPDGFPLLYTGSRDGRLRIIALDRPEPTELWSLQASRDGMWNNDWDSNPVVVDDVLYEGGEDSFFYAVELNRRRGPDGLVDVSPRVLVRVPGWDSDLLRRTGDRNVSIESSVAVVGHRAYFANSGGRVVGLDISAVRDGVAPVVFDYWVGDDVDATIVADADGMLYVAAELERSLPRAAEVGQLLKLDPTAAGDPRVWGVAVPPRPPPGRDRDDGGIWATPALHRGLLYVTTHPGDLLAVDTTSGEVVWEQDIGYHEWSSPVVVDGVLVVAGCEEGGLLAWSVAEPRRPRPLWSAPLPTRACIESTPAVWNGRVHVGARDGFFYTFGDGPGA